MPACSPARPAQLPFSSNQPELAQQRLQDRHDRAGSLEDVSGGSATASIPAAGEVVQIHQPHVQKVWRPLILQRVWDRLASCGAGQKRAKRAAGWVVASCTVARICARHTAWLGHAGNKGSNKGSQQKLTPKLTWVPASGPRVVPGCTWSRQQRHGSESRQQPGAQCHQARHSWAGPAAGLGVVPRPRPRRRAALVY